MTHMSEQEMMKQHKISFDQPCKANSAECAVLNLVSIDDFLEALDKSIL